MDLLNQSAFLKALGWSLLNSFWQFGLLWLLFLVVHAGKKNLTPTLKHAIAVSFLLIGFLWFAAGLSYQYFSFSQFHPSGKSAGTLHLDSISTLSYQNFRSYLDEHLFYISGLYLLIVAGLFIKFFRYFYYSHKIQTRGLIKIKAEVRLYVEQLSAKLDIKKKVQVWLSQYVDTPIIVGFLKPTILIPVACMNQLSISQLEAVILHELAHIKRNDYLLNLFIAISDIIFFFNPFSHLFTRVIQQERENSCDDCVLQFKFDRYQYASALLALEKNRASYLPLAIAVTGNKNKTLLFRIQRIMQVDVKRQVNGIKLLAYFLSIGLLAFVAFFNPGDVVITNLAKEFPPVEKVLLASREINTTQHKSHTNISAQAVVKKNSHIKTLNKKDLALQGESESAAAEGMALINVSDVDITGEQHPARILAAVKQEERAFSKTEEDEPEIPEVASATALPFLPASSFSYLNIDTSKPKQKAESYYERSARLTMAKAKKAMAQLDWKKIEKQLKDNKVDINKLRNEIEKSLENVNWQRINEEVNRAQASEDAEKMDALRAEAEAVTRYKTQQFQLQKLHNQLSLQEEFVKRDIEKQQLVIQQYLDEKQTINPQSDIRRDFEIEQQNTRKENQRRTSTDLQNNLRKDLERQQEAIKKLQRQKKATKIIVYI